jgi:hypothetical protein
MPKKLDLLGQTFGKVKVIRWLDESKKWLGVCECGRAVIRDSNLMKIAKSCAECHHYTFGDRMRTHSHTSNGIFSKTYNSWRGMKDRVLNPTHYGYKWYKEKGITICKRWIESFQDFLSDMGERPEGTTLDRVDNNKDYCKENCRWVSMTKQRRNRSDTVFIEYKGERNTAAGFAEKYGLPYKAVRSRLQEGWDIAKSLETPYPCPKEMMKKSTGRPKSKRPLAP